MKIVDLEQGEDPWHEWRKLFWTGSNAPKALGDSPYTSRDAFLTEVVTGKSPPVSDFLKGKFKEGHEAEAFARPIVEEILSGELGQPVTLQPACCEMEASDWPKNTPQKFIDRLDGEMACSLDGLSEDGKIIFEHKLFNQKLISAIAAGVLPNHIVWQLEHNLLVTGAEKAFFVTSDGTRENMGMFSYTRDTFAQSALIAGWYQFTQDLLTHSPVEVVDGSDDEQWQRIESGLDAIKNQIDELKETESSLRKEAKAFCAGRKVKGAMWTGATHKTQGNVNWAALAKAEAPKADYEKYRGESAEIFSLRRNKK